MAFFVLIFSNFNKMYGKTVTKISEDLVSLIYVLNQVNKLKVLNIFCDKHKITKVYILYFNWVIFFNFIY